MSVKVGVKGVQAINGVTGAKGGVLRLPSVVCKGIKKSTWRA